MEAPKSSSNKSSRLARTLHKVINLKPSSTKTGANNGGIGICILTSQDKVKEDSSTGPSSDHHHHHKSQSFRTKNNEKAVLEALIAKLFANITSIKASYAELQMAQHPYNSDAIQEADQAIVEELKAISELKRKFMRKQLGDLSPQVTLMLAEIHEQQALMKTYEIAVKKLEAEADAKEMEMGSLRKKLEETVLGNKSLEKKLNASGCLSSFDNNNFKLSGLNTTHFIQVLHYALRSIRSFVKVMVKEMEGAKWDFDLAMKFIEPEALLAKPNHRTYVFESYVSKTMFEGFNHPNFMLSPNETCPTQTQTHSKSHFCFDQFRKFKSLNPKHFLTQNPDSVFARFTKSKYSHLVHAKMECSFFGNLNQRKLVNSGGCPDSPFFSSFLEMSRRVWALHCLAFSYDQEVSIFQVKRNCRFNEVFMESVTDDVLCNTNITTTTTTSEESSPSSSAHSDPDLRVGFTVVPGFKIGKSVVQCQVYLSPVSTPVRSR